MEDTAPTIDERVVARIGLQTFSRFGVGHADIGPPVVQAQAGGDVQAGKLGQVGFDDHREDLLGPGHRFEALERPAHDRGVGRDRRREGQLP